MELRDYLTNVYPEGLEDEKLKSNEKQYRELQTGFAREDSRYLFQRGVILDNFYIHLMFLDRPTNIGFRMLYLLDGKFYKLTKTIKERTLHTAPDLFQNLLSSLVTLSHILKDQYPPNIEVKSILLKISRYGVRDVLFTEKGGLIYAYSELMGKTVKLVYYPPLISLLDDFNDNLRSAEYKSLFDGKLEQFIFSQVVDEIFSQFKYNITESVSIINARYNILHKYANKGFHYLHKLWAISIQWLLPLLLACYSSCDPLSIGDGDKLSELSLRLFISGFSFINLINVMDYSLPLGRDVVNWQHKHSDLAKVAKHDFLYTDEDFSYSGSEFRVDEKKGYQFGFEIRVFDNFDINNVNSLLEFLFLLADKVAYEGKVYRVNPFNNPVLNRESVRILQQGWNTRISREYLDLIESELEIPTSGFRDGLTAYQVCDQIYVWLQDKFIRGGKGMGPYSKYVVNRRTKRHHLPNINKMSWELNFNNLIWKPTNPKTKVRLLIEECIDKAIMKRQQNKGSKSSGNDGSENEGSENEGSGKESKESKESKVNRQLLGKLLTNKLKSPYSSDIEDIIYALESLGIINYWK